MISFIPSVLSLDNFFLSAPQFAYLKDQGTRIIIYNLWEDDQGSAELDFDSDEHVCN